MLRLFKDEYNRIFPIGETLSSNWFTGYAFLYPLTSKDKNNEFLAGNVTFEPGARTNWHTHPKGQVLIVIEGNGFYKEQGSSAQLIKKGRRGKYSGKCNTLARCISCEQNGSHCHYQFQEYNK